MPPTITPLTLAQELAPDESARPVPGASRYWITNHGRVFSTVAGLRQMKPSPDRKGYRQIDLYRDNSRARTRPTRWRPYVHELVALAFIGPRPTAPGIAYEIDHVDSDKTNNRLDNLQYVPRSLNLQRAIAAGRNPTTRLSAPAVWTLRCQALIDGDTVVVRQAVEQYGATTQTVRNALAGRTWATVPCPASRPTASQLAAALCLDSGAEARRLLALSPFSSDYVEADGEPDIVATARVLPFRLSADPQAA